MKEKILVTGGAGYIGSTICSALKDFGYEPIVLDSFITGRPEFAKLHIHYEGDIEDRMVLKKIFKDHPSIKYCIHCAALIVVPDSVERPYEYYKENVAKSNELFKNLNEFGCNNIIYSSSGSIYDFTPDFEVTEESAVRPHSPYSWTKYIVDLILRDFCRAYGMRGISFRYFNPIGTDPQMRTGIYLQFPSHLIGKLVNVAEKKEPVFKVTGVNWNTRDGTCIRDYIHVWDLALAHIKAIKNIDYAFKHAGDSETQHLVLNLGTGTGTTVREFVTAFEKVYGKKVKKVDAPPRPGDVVGQYANASLAKKLIKWEAERTIEDGIRDTLEWWEKRESIIDYGKKN